MTKFLWDCVFCGFPTKHPSQTCTAHRDLVPPIFDRILADVLDESEPVPVESESDADRP